MKGKQLDMLKEKKLLIRNAEIQNCYELLESDAQRCRFEELSTKFYTNDIHWIVDGICKRKEFTCELTMKVFIWKAIQAHLKTNCLTEVLFDEAMRTAKKYDEDFIQNGKIQGILHGIPVSLKDNLDIVGYDTTLGVVSKAFQPRNGTSNIVNGIIEAGGIPFAKTNVPQTLISFECSNYLWGTTVNPYDSQYTSGGSSGGEAALIALKGSIFGVGNDIGGSLRIPAHFCGIYSLKPTVGRIQNETAIFSPHQEFIQPVNGPMTSSIENLIIATKILIDSYQNPLKISYNPFSNNHKLRIGVIRSIEPIKPTPACHRILSAVEERLHTNGLEVVEIQLNGISKGVILFYALFTADGCENLLETLNNEPLEQHLAALFSSIRTPLILKRALGWIWKKCGGNADYAKLLECSCKKSVAATWKIQHEISEYKNEMRAQLKELNVDCIIMPTFPSPATKNNSFSYISFCSLYTFLWNIIDVPVGCIPVGHVDAEKDKIRPRQKAQLLSGFEYLMEKMGLFDAKEMHGLPVGIQIISPLPFTEEKLLFCMKEIDLLLKNQTDINKS